MTDATGASVPNAKVTATLAATGQQRDSLSNSAGEFVIPQLAPGGYRVNVTAVGFLSAVVENITLNIAERAIVNVSLKVGQVSEELTIIGSVAPLLEPETASLGLGPLEKVLKTIFM